MRRAAEESPAGASAHAEPAPTKTAVPTPQCYRQATDPTDILRRSDAPSSHSPAPHRQRTALETNSRPCGTVGGKMKIGLMIRGLRRNRYSRSMMVTLANCRRPHTHGLQSVAAAGSFQFVEHGGEQLGARGAERVAECERRRRWG